MGTDNIIRKKDYTTRMASEGNQRRNPTERCGWKEMYSRKCQREKYTAVWTCRV